MSQKTLVLRLRIPKKCKIFFWFRSLRGSQTHYSNVSSYLSFFLVLQQKSVTETKMRNWGVWNKKREFKRGGRVFARARSFLRQTQKLYIRLAYREQHENVIDFEKNHAPHKMCIYYSEGRVRGNERKSLHFPYHSLRCGLLY